MKKVNVKQITGVAILVALIVILQSLSLALPKIGPGISISLVLIPVVLGGAVYGPKAGAILGGAFAAIVYIFCINGFDLGGAAVFQANSILCLLVVGTKGILCGWLSALAFSVLKKKNTYVAMLVASIVCVLVNTGTFLLGINLFFTGVLNAWMQEWGKGNNVFVYMLSTIVLLNMVPELILNVVFSPAAARIYKSVKTRF